MVLILPNAASCSATARSRLSWESLDDFGFRPYSNHRAASGSASPVVAYALLEDCCAIELANISDNNETILGGILVLVVSYCGSGQGLLRVRLHPIRHCHHPALV